MERVSGGQMSREVMLLTLSPLGADVKEVRSRSPHSVVVSR
jgi:hypothetical protein